MRRAALVALLASTVTGAALAQEAPAQTAGDSRWSVSAEALLAWFKSSPTPVPIITDNYLDAPGVNVLLGGGSVDTNPNAGLKITGTYRIDSSMGVELTGFYIPTRSTSSSVSSSGQPGSVDLLLPFHDVTSNQENVTEISHWPDYRGSAQATLSNNLGGGEFNVTWAMPPRDAWRVDLLGGFRFLQLRESYTITTSSPFNPPNPSDIWNTTDAFDTRNRFYGLQVGARAAYDQGPWVGSVIGKGGTRHDAAKCIDQRFSRNQRLQQLRTDADLFRRVFRASVEQRRLLTQHVRGSARGCAQARLPAYVTGHRLRGLFVSLREQRGAARRADQPQHQSDPRRWLTATTTGHARLARRNRHSTSTPLISGRRLFPSAWCIASRLALFGAAAWSAVVFPRFRHRQSLESSC